MSINRGKDEETDTDDIYGDIYIYTHTHIYIYDIDICNEILINHNKEIK